MEFRWINVIRMDLKILIFTKKYSKNQHLKTVNKVGHIMYDVEYNRAENRLQTSWKWRDMFLNKTRP